jgi:hypothetical protein
MYIITNLNVHEGIIQSPARKGKKENRFIGLISHFAPL